MSKYIWLLDAGHGGVIAGKYQTEGKRSPIWADGSVLYEGEFNRAIVNRLAELCTAEGIQYVLVAPEQEDKTLGERVKFVNDWASVYSNCILVSVHANAGGGTGYEVYTSVGETDSDKIAEVFFIEHKKMFPDSRMRQDTTDGDVDKEALFQVLTRTKCPSVLTEDGFYDNETECKWLMSKEGRDNIALAKFNAIKRIDKYGY